MCFLSFSPSVWAFCVVVVCVFANQIEFFSSHTHTASEHRFLLRGFWFRFPPDTFRRRFPMLLACMWAFVCVWVSNDWFKRFGEKTREYDWRPWQVFFFEIKRGRSTLLLLLLLCGIWREWPLPLSLSGDTSPRVVASSWLLDFLTTKQCFCFTFCVSVCVCFCLFCF